MLESDWLCKINFNLVKLSFLRYIKAMGYCFINVLLCLCDLYSHPAVKTSTDCERLKKDVLSSALLSN